MWSTRVPHLGSMIGKLTLLRSTPSPNSLHEGAIGEAAAAESSDDDLFPELYRERREARGRVSVDFPWKEAARSASSKPEGAAPSAPSAEGPPLPSPVPGSKAEELRAEATSEKHLRTHFPSNPFCKICNIAKNT